MDYTITLEEAINYNYMLISGTDYRLYADEIMEKIIKGEYDLRTIDFPTLARLIDLVSQFGSRENVEKLYNYYTNVSLEYIKLRNSISL